MNNINLNPTRDGILRALNLMQANIQTNNKRTINGELIGDLEIKTSELKGCELTNNFSRLMIDEYPILSIAAAFAKSPSVFKGLGELKVKESNRLELIRHNLHNCGIFCKVSGEDLFIDPTKKISPKENQIKTDNDHRIAMSFAIMGMKLGVDLYIADSEFIKIAESHMEALNHALINIPEEKVRIHICWGNYEGPHCCDIDMTTVFATLMKAKARYTLFETSNPRHAHEWTVFRDRKNEIPDNKILVPGVVDTTTNFIEHPELVAERIGKFVNIVGKDRVIAGSDCGFGTFAGFGAVDPDIAFAKLKTLSEGAEIANKRL